MTDRPHHPRIGCVVPFCRRGSTLHPPGWEFLCGVHWRLVDRRLKLRRQRLMRIGRRHDRPWRLWKIEHMIWVRMRRQAIERAGGV